MPRMIQSGQLRQRLTIQRRSRSQNDFGEQETTWLDDTVIWGDIMPMRGQEYNFARQERSELTHRIITRWTIMSDGTRPTADNCRFKYYDWKSEVERFFDVKRVFPPYEKKYMLEWEVIEGN